MQIQYISNFEQSQRALKFAEEREEWQYFVKHWRMLLPAAGRGSHAIGDLLIQPVQRIPRYTPLYFILYPL